MNLSTEDPKEWTCGLCGEPLAVSKVGFSYMKGVFEVELPACAACGMVLIPEDLVYGKMADTERILEDK